MQLNHNQTDTRPTEQRKLFDKYQKRILSLLELPRGNETYTLPVYTLLVDILESSPWYNRTRYYEVMQDGKIDTNPKIFAPHYQDIPTSIAPSIDRINQKREKYKFGKCSILKHPRDVCENIKYKMKDLQASNEEMHALIVWHANIKNPKSPMVGHADIVIIHRDGRVFLPITLVDFSSAIVDELLRDEVFRGKIHVGSEIQNKAGPCGDYAVECAKYFLKNGPPDVLHTKEAPWLLMGSLPQDLIKTKGLRYTILPVELLKLFSQIPYVVQNNAVLRGIKGEAIINSDDKINVRTLCGTECKLQVDPIAMKYVYKSLKTYLTSLLDPKSIFHKIVDPEWMEMVLNSIAKDPSFKNTKFAKKVAGMVVGEQYAETALNAKNLYVPKITGRIGQLPPTLHTTCKPSIPSINQGRII